MNDKADPGHRGAAYYVDPLPFRLGGFLGVAWTSARARENWAPRLSQVRDVVRDVEWRSVANGERACALFSGNDTGNTSLQHESAAHGLSWCAVSEADKALGHYWLTEKAIARSPSRQAVVIANDRHLAEFLAAWRQGDYGVVGHMLGVPACCVETCQETCGDGQLIDPTWVYATRRNPDMQTNEITVSSSEARVDATNTLLRWVGLRAVSYFPCSYECPATADVARKLEHTAEAAGSSREWEWLMTILSWPAEWTALHGIAEVRTPILKFRTATDATASKYTVRWAGRSFPQDGAAGLGFPYRAALAPRERRLALPLVTTDKVAHLPSVPLRQKLRSEPQETSSPRTIDIRSTEATAEESALTPVHRPATSLPRSLNPEEASSVAQASIVIVGSGIKVPDHLTIEALRVLASASEIWTNVPELEHAELAKVVGQAPHSLWPFFRTDRPRLASYQAITTHLLERARAVRHLAYLTQGHPLVLDRVATELLRQSNNQGVSVSSVLPGISSIDTILADIRYEPARGLQVFDATTFVRRETRIDGRAGLLLLQPGVFGTDMPRLTSNAPVPQLTDLQDALHKTYPGEHPAILIRSATASMAKQRFQTTIGDLHSVPATALAASTLWIPPLDFERQRPRRQPEVSSLMQS
jgi:siroheme synthase